MSPFSSRMLKRPLILSSLFACCLTLRQNWHCSWLTRCLCFGFVRESWMQALEGRRERKRERERECVCVCEDRESEERERVCVCERIERGRTDREREREREKERERERTPSPNGSLEAIFGKISPVVWQCKTKSQKVFFRVLSFLWEFTFFILSFLFSLFSLVLASPAKSWIFALKITHFGRASAYIYIYICWRGTGLSTFWPPES